MSEHRDWRVSSRIGEQTVHLYDLGLRARLWDLAETVVCGACDLGFGGHKAPAWAWRVPVGRPKWDLSDDDPWLENSLASRWCDFESWVGGKAYGAATRCGVASVSLDRETATQIAPDMAWLWDEDDAA